jgi:hypothetical protein
MARSGVKVKNQDAVAGLELARMCGSDHARTPREGSQLRGPAARRASACTLRCSRNVDLWS